MDVYDTLLNMGEVERRVNLLFDSKRGYAIWFEMFMEYCFVDNCTVQFNDFTSIAYATLQMTAKLFSVTIDEEDGKSIIALLKSLPVNEGVQEGLSNLHKQNFRIAALTNASEKTVTERMEFTGLISYFEMVLSAEHVKKYKPCCEVYEWALKKMQARPEEVLLITSHGWDVAGAANVGLKTAYINGKKLLYPLSPQPDYIGNDLNDIAEQLMQMNSPNRQT